VSIFSYLEYTSWLKDLLKSKPKQGYGEIGRWAKACGVHPTLMSLILRGSRDLSAEQAHALGQHLELTPLELEYFIGLVSLARAGTQSYRTHLEDKLARLRAQATKVKRRFQHESELSEEAKFIFYSSHLYSLIRLSCDTHRDGVSTDELGERLKIPRAELIPKLEFLSQTGLIKEVKGRWKMGPSRTLVSRESIHVIKHHQNWRTQAMLKAESLRPDELMFTCPMSISVSDFEAFRLELTQLIQRFSKMLENPHAERVGCFNLDLFWMD